MKLVSFLSPDGDARAGVCIGDSVCDVSALAAAVGVDLPSDMTELLIVDEGLEITNNIVARVGDFPSLSFDQVTLLAAVPFPGKVLALAGNYQAHIQEGGGTAVDKTGITPRVFMKPGTSIIGTNEPILLPQWSETVDYELELTIVIGQECKNVDVDDATECIAGYVVSNDVSARSLTIAEGRSERPMDEFFDWLNGKWFDSFGAIGPNLVTRDEISDPHNLKMSLTVNGEKRQEGNTGQMIFNCFEIVSFCSHLVTLEPGDLIMTGTPSGVGQTSGTYLKSGDEIEAEIEHLGVLRNVVEEED
ncbi:MAG: FAA hydrolase family protein [Candidatus Latescibacteria bacterium]|jgi:2-keto-4-pentenoate hydratase/2-oxohepta-3-ene-1,7-dioic acid hydratase in catechol pathway|nr:FAA hydrolase family protein [Candidatus Latescibacterota bacterium]